MLRHGAIALDGTAPTALAADELLSFFPAAGSWAGMFDSCRWPLR
jgi:hypothetical protein